MRVACTYTETEKRSAYAAPTGSQDEDERRALIPRAGEGNHLSRRRLQKERALACSLKTQLQPDDSI